MLGLTIVAIVSAIAAVVQIQGGFGYSLLVFPVAAATASPSIAFAVCVVMELLFGLHTWLFEQRRLSLSPTILGLVALALMGLGLFRFAVLPHLEEAGVWWVGTIAALAGGLVLLIQPSILPVNRATVALAAVASGLLGAACGIAGPPILLLFFADQRNSWPDIRAGLAGFFSLLYLGIAIMRWDVFAVAYPGGIPLASALMVGFGGGLIFTIRKRIEMSTRQWSIWAGFLIISSCLLSSSYRLLAPE